MPDPNPYESPKIRQPKRAKIAKQTIGVTAVILLTPIALAIALTASCGATWGFVDLVAPNYAVATFGGWAIFLVPPVVTLAFMIWWARREYIAKRNQQKRSARASQKESAAQDAQE
jgi:hypothetical protein